MSGRVLRKRIKVAYQSTIQFQLQQPEFCVYPTSSFSHLVSQLVSQTRGEPELEVLRLTLSNLFSKICRVLVDLHSSSLFSSSVDQAQILPHFEQSQE